MEASTHPCETHNFSFVIRYCVIGYIMLQCLILLFISHALDDEISGVKGHHILLTSGVPQTEQSLAQLKFQ